MTNWKEDMISRIQEERLEKEIKDMEVDFTKHREEINQEFDNLCKEIEELDYDSSIHMERIGGVGECLRRFTVLGIEYSLYITENQIIITAYYNEQEISKQICLVVGEVGEPKWVRYINGKEDEKSIKKLDTTKFNYTEILNILMDNAYKEGNDEIKNLKIKKQDDIENLKIKKQREIHENKTLEDFLNGSDVQNQ